MAQNNFISDEIDREATKMWPDTYHQNFLPGKNIILKTIETFSTISSKLWYESKKVAYCNVHNWLPLLSGMARNGTAYSVKNLNHYFTEQNIKFQY